MVKVSLKLELYSKNKILICLPLERNIDRLLHTHTHTHSSLSLTIFYSFSDELQDPFTQINGAKRLHDSSKMKCGDCRELIEMLQRVQGSELSVTVMK